MVVTEPVTWPPPPTEMNKLEAGWVAVTMPTVSGVVDGATAPGVPLPDGGAVGASLPSDGVPGTKTLDAEAKKGCSG